MIIPRRTLLFQLMFRLHFLSFRIIYHGVFNIEQSAVVVVVAAVVAAVVVVAAVCLFVCLFFLLLLQHVNISQIPEVASCESAGRSERSRKFSSLGAAERQQQPPGNRVTLPLWEIPI